MSEQYFTASPSAQHDEQEVIFESFGFRFSCTTDAGVFCREGLDMGSRILLETIGREETQPERILDLGCGWGPVGLALAKRFPEAEVVLTDVNERATGLAKRNLRANCIAKAQVVTGDGFENVAGSFDLIALNPPIRAGKALIYQLFADCGKHLSPGGALYIVIRKQQGAESALKYLKEIFSEAERIERDKGYWVIRAK